MSSFSVVDTENIDYNAFSYTGLCVDKKYLENKNVKLSSLLRLETEFTNLPIEKMIYYDLREYELDGVKYYPYVFGKTLEHDPITGFVKKEDADKLINAVEMGDEKSLNEIVQFPESVRQFVGFLCQKSCNLIGTDSIIPRTYNIEKIDSEEMMFEMLEVYGQYLLRSTSFVNYSSSPITPVILSDLNKFNSVTENSLFRGSTSGELAGPYISQFLLTPFYIGAVEMDQKYIVEENFIPESITREGWFNIQNGVSPPGVHRTGESSYIHNGQVLCSVVHNDPLYQLYYNAAIIALANNIKPFVPVYDSKINQWTTGGGPDILATLAQVSLGALRVAWENKWNIMRIRPEVFAQRINSIKNIESFVGNVPGFANIKKEMIKGNNILNLVEEQGNLLLPLMYPEGSPVHPSCPAGHACVAGACVTILKAMFKTHDSEGNDILWNSENRKTRVAVDANTLVEYENIPDMTITGEFNKLASNVSIGRDFAGVHYRSDAVNGMYLGEQYAISFLKDKKSEYYQLYSNWFTHFEFQKFNGDMIIV